MTLHEHPAAPGEVVGTVAQRFFDLSLDLLSVMDADSGCLLAVNRAWEWTLGWRVEDLVGHLAMELVHPADVEDTLRAERELRDTGGHLREFDNRWRAADGSYRRLQWSARAHEGRWYCVAKDVTDAREESERRRRETELYRAVASNLADGLYVSGPDGAIRYVNPSALALLGYAADELLGDAGKAILGRGCGPGCTGAQPTAYRRKDGTELPVACSSSPIQLADGLGTIVVFRDTTAERAAAAAREEAAAQVRRSEALHRTLSANLPDTTVFLVDRDLRVLLAEGEAIQRFPWVAEDRFLGRRLPELEPQLPTGVLEAAIQHHSAALRGQRRSFEACEGGVTFAFEVVPVHESGRVESVLVVARDVTSHTVARQQIARRARQQHAVAELGRTALATPDLAQLLDTALRTATTTLGVAMGRVLRCEADAASLAVAAATGLPEPLATGRVPATGDGPVAHVLADGEPLLVEDLRAETRFAAPELRELGVASLLSVTLTVERRRHGVLTVFSREARAFSAEDASFLTSVATLMAIAIERRKDEEAARHAALHDPLTGLPNRILALDRLEHALARRRREGIDVAVLALDLDRFKTINDALGHAAGDQVLTALAPRLVDTVRPTDTVARLGGDEFVVICPAIGGARGAAEMAEKLAAAAQRPVLLDTGEHVFTISSGITIATSDADTPGSLLRDADAALYRAKERGPGRSELFDDTLRARVMTRVRVEKELRRAIDRDELEAWYQPVIDLGTGRIVSTEALVRWIHPARGIVAPPEFIPIAEESGLIRELGRRVLEDACRQTAAWQRGVAPGLTVSVNVSGRQAIDPSFPRRVAEIARRSGLRPGTLALEITESVLMEESDSPADALAALQRHDLTVILDDFGTGYSSLSRLKRMPLDVLKIDRSFVAGLEHDADDRAIVQATIHMAHAVGLTVVAEGVETREQEARLRELGCDRAQGFLYARPQPASALDGMLAAG